MKNLKRIIWFAAGTILAVKCFKKIKKEKEHCFILDQLKSNRDILKIEDPKKTGIKFIKHPRSKNLSADGKIRWDVRVDGVMMIQLDDNNLIEPSNQDKQFYYYFHERGHLENKDNGHFKKETACGYNVYNCLRRELEAELYFMKALKKIGKTLEKADWSKNRRAIRKQCKKCLKLIDQGKCPKKERKKIEKCLKIISRNIKK